MRIFHHGIQLPDYKNLSLSTPSFKKAFLPEQATLCLKQHEGLPAIPIVACGDHVFTGTKIAVAQGDFSANLHSSISGEVTEIHKDFVRVESDGKDEWDPRIREEKTWRDSSQEEILNRIFEGGIVGMGGRAFPTYLKLKNAGAISEPLILNGCESEPFITSDFLLMLQRPTEVLHGAELLLKASGRRKCIIAVEDNKLEAIELLLSKIRTLQFKTIDVKTLPTRYPQGAESELSRAVLGRRTSQAGDSLLFNVATAFAVYEAVRYHKPLVERVVTITGHCVVEPKNFVCRIGTSISEVIKNCKGFLRDPDRVILGGPMAGVSITDLETPLTKAVNGIVALAPEFIGEASETPCIRCGLCVEVCPEHLIPETLVKAIRKEEKSIAEEFRLMDCIGCGSCTYICPSKIPIAVILRKGKVSLLGSSSLDSLLPLEESMDSIIST